MIIYNYSPIDKVFTFEKDAVESPLEIGVYLVPACATTIPPPKTTGVERAVFLSGKWSIVEDNRGAWYNVREPVVVTELGPVPEGYTKEPLPLSEQELNEIAQEQLRIVEIEKAVEAAEIHKFTPEQANKYIEERYAEATTVGQIKAVTVDLMKKLAALSLR